MNLFERITATQQSVLLARAATDRSVADTDTLIDIAHDFRGGNGFIDTAIPMYITAVEFPKGECHLFSADSDIKLPRDCCQHGYPRRI